MFLTNEPEKQKIVKIESEREKVEKRGSRKEPEVSQKRVRAVLRAESDVRM